MPRLANKRRENHENNHARAGGTHDTKVTVGFSAQVDATNFVAPLLPRMLHKANLFVCNLRRSKNGGVTMRLTRNPSKPAHHLCRQMIVNGQKFPCGAARRG